MEPDLVWEDMVSLVAEVPNLFAAIVPICVEPLQTIETNRKDTHLDVPWRKR